MDKMREEFEAWACNYNLTVADWGNYTDRHVNNMWKAWKASRAALCVELPNIGEQSGFGSYIVFDAETVKELLKDSGVSCK